MSVTNFLQWILCLLLLAVGGCAAVNVDIDEQIAWDQIEIAVLQPPPTDPWQLTPAIEEELRAMGLEVAATGAAKPDLLVRFFVEEGPDLNAEGDLLSRLQSVHVQFLDPISKENLAVVDYFYPADGLTGAREGVKEAFAELRREVRTARSVVEPVAPAEAPPVPEPRQPIPATGQAHAEEAKSTPPAPSGPGQARQGMDVPALREKQDSAPTSDGAEIAPATDRSEAQPVSPQTHSPWVPRFESWGFENWGKEPDVEGY